MKPPSLATLPVEIQEEICRKLCTHCERSSDFRSEAQLSGGRPSELQQYADHVLRYRESKHALANLSRTSKRFHALAHPILYHCIRLENVCISDMQTPIAILPLARTLFFRLDLGRQVRELTIMGWDAVACVATWLDPAWQDIWAEAVDRGLPADFPWELSQAIIPDPWAVFVRPHVLPVDRDRHLVYQREKFLLQIVLACVSKLEVLNLGDRLLKDWYRFLEPDSLPLLVCDKARTELSFPCLQSMTISMGIGRESPAGRYSMLDYFHKTSPALENITVIWPVTSIDPSWHIREALAVFRSKLTFSWACCHQLEIKKPMVNWAESMDVDTSDPASLLPFYDMRCLTTYVPGDLQQPGRTMVLRDNQSGQDLIRIQVTTNKLGSGVVEHGGQWTKRGYGNCRVVFRASYGDINPWNLQPSMDADGEAGRYYRQLWGLGTDFCHVGTYRRRKNTGEKPLPANCAGCCPGITGHSSE